jgi:transcriptional regulator GlxA family with amidase domain
MPERLIVMLAFPGGNLIDIAGPLQAFETACRVEGNAGPEAYRLVTASEQGGPIKTAPGVVIATEALASLDASAIDTLIVPGGLPMNGIFDLDLLVAWLAENGPKVRRLCSVCTGAFLLGDAGLLDGKRATTHWSRCAELHERHKAIRLEPDRIFVNDGKVWTSGGVTAGIDLALALIEADLGHQTAIATARQLVMFVKRPGGQSQFSAPLALQSAGASGFSALHGWMAEHLHEDLRVERLAAQAGKSARTFARVYAAEVGQTPARAVEIMRLEAACRALEQSNLPFKAIAADVGLGSEQNLRRVMQRQFGIGPSDYRERFGAQAGFRV